ncbi:MAG: type II toxin-antitoxin system Phd/YefM family antitoxin [Clostridiales bacterium]|nr:type II toxin-antitoxin system Phd/YefM family antitoxin [Clostridiales bacterium]
MALAQTQASVSELKANLSKYIMIAQDQDVLITRNGKVTAKLVSAKVDKVAAFEHLLSLYPEGIEVDTDEIREQRREERFA